MKTLASNCLLEFSFLRHDNKCRNIFKMNLRSTLFTIHGIALTLAPCMLAKTGKDTEREDRIRWWKEVAITAALADRRKGGGRGSTTCRMCNSGIFVLNLPQHTFFMCNCYLQKWFEPLSMNVKNHRFAKFSALIVTKFS
jgi:hypothetical protein